MRDLRDTSLRCLRLSSISDGLSKYLIDQIVFAMLHYNTGVQALAKLALLDDPEHGAGQLSVDTDDCVAVVRRSEDRQFCPLYDSHRVFDFASAERCGVTVLPQRYPSDSPLAALAIIKAAGNIGKSIVAVSAADDNWIVTVATDDGDYGSVHVDDAATFLSQRCHISADQIDAIEKYRAHTVIVTVNENPLRKGELKSAADINARRDEALRDGLLVDSDVWEKVRAHSRDFLVDLPA
ncbi:MAG: hypothetical protein Q4P05_00675 [Actinomycetaceae bacterium]|nr:hypothetical protein [Actinomycetaceae bacterium]